MTSALKRGAARIFWIPWIAVMLGAALGAVELGAVELGAVKRGRSVATVRAGVLAL